MNKVIDIDVGKLLAVLGGTDAISINYRVFLRKMILNSVICHITQQ